jgi:hypothetical protein
MHDVGFGARFRGGAWASVAAAAIAAGASAVCCTVCIDAPLSAAATARSS